MNWNANLRTRTDIRGAYPLADYISPRSMTDHDISILKDVAHQTASGPGPAQLQVQHKGRFVGYLGQQNDGTWCGFDKDGVLIQGVRGDTAALASVSLVKKWRRESKQWRKRRLGA